MSYYKAKVDFSGYTGPQLGPVAQTIHDQMVKNAALFPTGLPFTMPVFQTAITTFTEALAAKASRASADYIAFEVARHALEADLAELGNSVNGVAKGDESIVNASGFPYYNTATNRPDTAPPPAPDGVVLRHGDLPGSFLARYHAGRTPSMNEAQTCAGDPNLEANWQHAGMFSGGRALVGGIVPGTAVWFRVRTAGLKGVMGAWSDPAKIMVV